MYWSSVIWESSRPNGGSDSHLLYTYVGDSVPGHATGDDIDLNGEFGTKWRSRAAPKTRRAFL